MEFVSTLPLILLGKLYMTLTSSLRFLRSVSIPSMSSMSPSREEVSPLLRRSVSSNVSSSGFDSDAWFYCHGRDLSWPALSSPSSTSASSPSPWMSWTQSRRSSSSSDSLGRSTSSSTKIAPPFAELTPPLFRLLLLLSE